MKHSTDLSILAWSTSHVPDTDSRWSTVVPLARSPANFAGSGGIFCEETRTEAFEMTNRGLRIKFDTFDERIIAPSTRLFAAILTGCRSENESRRPLALTLYHHPSYGTFRWAGANIQKFDRRERSDKNPFTYDSAVKKKIFSKILYLNLSHKHAQTQPYFINRLPHTTSYMCTFAMHYRGAASRHSDEFSLRLPPNGHWPAGSNTLEYSNIYSADGCNGDGTPNIKAILIHQQGTQTQKVASVVIELPLSLEHSWSGYGIFRSEKIPVRRHTRYLGPWPANLYLEVHAQGGEGRKTRIVVSIGVNRNCNFDGVRDDYKLLFRRCLRQHKTTRRE
ncbi:hypothetical protein FB567DRAFT_117051 [Paraphoma chrysanthemicola]|uniref:Uncharacterized protein n=1 Tax=Paraphoma chrysanthemicola TaxID=798071 RepID=A0A8K0VVG8_9PLEO|nr:hypothetical protein FB567DRAFT_117051 [Paraphoma chrysanthemicola]